MCQNFSSIIGSCPNEPLMNGMIDYAPNPNSRQVGTIATLRCNNNYGLVPANGAIRECQNNLLWSGPKPDCRGTHNYNRYVLYIYCCVYVCYLCLLHYVHCTDCVIGLRGYVEVSLPTKITNFYPTKITQYYTVHN